MIERVNPFDYSTHIMKALQSGILLTTMADGKVNTMTIAWGFMGIDWNTPIFATLVRKNRFTYSRLEQNPEFTINVPTGNYDRRVLGVAGTKSGRDIDKIGHLGLHLHRSQKVSVPGIFEFPLTLECSVIYKQPQDPAAIPPQIAQAFHPQHIDSYAPGLNRDYHTVFFGAIVDAYIITQ